MILLKVYLNIEFDMQCNIHQFKLYATKFKQVYYTINALNTTYSTAKCKTTAFQRKWVLIPLFLLFYIILTSILLCCKVVTDWLDAYNCLYNYILPKGDINDSAVVTTWQVQGAWAWDCVYPQLSMFYSTRP